MSRKSLFSGLKPAHPVKAKPFEEDDWHGLGVLAVVVAYVAALFVGDVFALAGTVEYMIKLLLPAVAWSAFDVRKRSTSDSAAGGSDESSLRSRWLPAVVRGTAITASFEILGDALKGGGLTTLGRLLAPAGASPDLATKCGWVFFASVGVSMAARRALLRKLRQ